MADGKVVIETDLDSSGIEKGLKKSEKSMKSQAASMAAEYRKQGMSASDAFKKAWSEIERGSSASASTAKREFSEMGQSAEQAASHAEREWKSSSTGIGSAISKIGSLASKGLKVATVAITGTAAALGGVSAAAIKVGSDFESQMSRVKAISGATGEEFEKLKEQAIQLGADTAFSSKQAAEGMENLAAAGFATNEIVDAMPGLLSLAAAAGEDLATSSDIAASTLRGFGLEAKDMAHVADVLAANANRTNSSVAQTGDAMKYVAPLARAAGLSLEETAAAIGIMADAGIQGSQAGTTLRGAISRLSKPTDDMQEAMDELGISFYDSNGKMKSLTEQVGMLRKATEGMTDEQRNNLLVTLYGQEALSGMMALINEGEGSLGDLTEAYKACDGEAQKAAETMQDNLSSALEQLSGSAESLGIVFYESVAENLKKTAQSATDSVNNIADAFKSGGMNAAIQAAGDEFANLATAAAEHAPEMVDTAVDFIESFGSGITKNKKKLYNSAVDMAETLGTGLARILPDELERPVESAVKSIASSLNSGGLKKAGKTVETTFKNVIEIVGKLADVALPPLTKAIDFAGDHFDLLATSATATFTAFKGYKIFATTSKAMSGLSATVKMLSAAEKANTLQVLEASGALTTKEMVVGVLTGKITLATAAQTAWNTAMNANPIGIVVTAIGALTAGLVAYKIATNDSEASQYALTEEQKKANKEIHKQYEAYKELDSARKDAMSGIDAEYAHLTELKDELNALIDTNGKVKSGYEDRANFIVSELSSALGLEKEQIWEIINANGNLEDSIDQVIEKKKAEAYLNANEEAYAEAIKNKSSALQTYVGKLAECKEAEEAYNEAQAAATSVMEEYQEMFKASPEAAQAYIEAQNGVLVAAEEAKKTFKEQKKALSEAEERYVGYNATIQNYEGLSSAIVSGDADKINSALFNMKNSFITAETGTKKSLEKQVKNAEKAYKDIQKAIKDGTPGITQEAVDGAKQMVDAAKAEMDKFEAKAKESTKKAGDGAVQGLNEKMPDFTNSAKNSALAWTMGFQNSEEFLKSGKKAGWSVKQGVDSTQQEINESGINISDSLNKNLGSADTKATGKAKLLEYNLGIGSQKGNIDKTSDLIAESSNKKLGSKDTKKTGSKKLSEYNFGVGSQKGNVDSTARNIANSANSILGSADTRSTGSSQGGKYNSGLGSMNGNINSTAIALSDTANRGLGAANTAGTGSNQGLRFSRGVGSVSAYSDGASVSETAKSGMGSVDASGTGSNFVQGFVNGFGLVDVWNAAKSIGEQALGAIKKSLGIHSPSRAAMALGEFFGQGFVLGVGNKEKEVAKTSNKLGEIALNSLDLTSVSRRAREVMAFNSSRISQGIAGRNMQIQHIVEQDKNRLTDREIEAIGKGVASVVNARMEEFRFIFKERELGRAVRSVT
jgi:TP901 family phage tail tape measure protein